MDKNQIIKLKEIDTGKLDSALSIHLKTIGATDNYLNGIVVAYILFQSAVNSKVFIDSKNDFESSYDCPESVKRVINETLNENWQIILDLKDKFSKDELLAYILFNNDVENYRAPASSTPPGVIELALSILDIQENDDVLELCSGKGNFIIEAYLSNKTFRYEGVELNSLSNDIAKLRAEILGEDFTFTLDDAFEYRVNQKADKIFANYPFMVKTPNLLEHKEKIANKLSIPFETIQKASSDWLFNAVIVEQLKKQGRAVAIMTNGATWNLGDKLIRQYFIENGLIETIIALPANLFKDTRVATTLIVFSQNNTSIKMIDASEIFERTRRNNIISHGGVDAILDILKNGGKRFLEKDISDFINSDYNLYPSYYIDEVPKFENGVKLESIVKNITRGVQTKADDLDKMKALMPTNYRCLTLANISDGILNFEDCPYLKEIPTNMYKFCVKNNSIVLTRTGSPAFKSAVVQIKDNAELLVTGNFFTIELDEKRVYPFYLQAFLSSEIGQNLLQRIFTGTGIPILNINRLKELVVPLPDMDTQIKIGQKYASAIDSVTSLKRSLEKSIQSLKHIYDENI